MQVLKKSSWGHSDSVASTSEEKNPDLATILSVEQRVEFTFLLARGAESIRKNIEATFDATHLPQGPASGLSPPSDKSAESETKASALQQEREKLLSEPKLQELKSAALQYLDDWRESVLQRVAEAVNSSELSKGQKSQAKATETSAKPKKDIAEADDSVDTALRLLYPPIPTPLAKLPHDQRILILHSTLLLLLSLKHYTAHSRILLLYITSSLGVSMSILAQDEIKVAQGLLKVAKQLSGDAEVAKKAEGNKNSRYWKVGLASVAGAAIIGVTGGLAAPLVAAGIGGVMGGLGLGATAAAGYLGTLAGSSVLVASLFGAYGAKMTGEMIDAYAKEVEDFAFLPIRGLHRRSKADQLTAVEDRRLRVAIGISGWLTEKEEILEPWRVIGGGSEVFALRWELEAVLNLGNNLTIMLKTAAWNYAKREILMKTMLAGLMTALWPLALLKVSRVVDNPFSVAKSRGDKAGEVLADALINKAQGERPVTLVGYSLGARVIYTCLMSLAARGAFGLVESVVLIGTPAPSEASDWISMRSVVSGRLVNVFSKNDYVLAFLYRTSSIQYGVAGLQEIEGIRGVENVDVSKEVSGHLRYRHMIGSILHKIGFEDLIMEEVEKEEEMIHLLDMEEDRLDHKSKEDFSEADIELHKLEKETPQKP